ncbi:PP2C family protein-serine/threonine phosphatase [Pseudonocardia sp.]|jgi:serine phosphatase RsbU (regulator of sigma subunit)|uniref:PP2C family protein-serine/threonine phosphatase n=1 Tax=Pseudonocardia sp. TaxID=60912 RepID=UPI00262F4A9D|nr:PP2C family protein-serine/threonine phosphatase [Pseudonocardia sp.]MCW2718866.1 hypothetical protein [Pseudonocardia sp.]MDT7617183.1 hypothetical protein [Pseudonocardiales bacterium]
MAGHPEPRTEQELLGDLVGQLDTATPYELVEVCQAWLARRVGARWSGLLLVDYSQTVLEPVPGRGSGTSPGRPHTVADGPAGTAYREQRVVRDPAPAGTEQSPDPGEVVVYVPVTVRTERLGVLMVAVAQLTPAVTELLSDAARVLAHVLVVARRYTDRFEMLRRRKDLGLAAEIQWELLPVLAYELPAFSIAGALEPTYDIGGDTFDYAVSATRLTITVTDAVGHGLRAALLGSLAVTAMRNLRRRGEDICAQAAAANQHLVEQFPGAEFVTGLLLEIDAPTGSARLLNAGHPAPLLLRDGLVETVQLPPDLPLGLDRATVYQEHTLPLRSGDRLLLLTDGITEAHHRGAPPFGTPHVKQLLTSLAHLPPAEFVRHLTRAVLDHRGGDLADDATAVCLDWH